VLTLHAYRHLGIAGPARATAQIGLFDEADTDAAGGNAGAG
jgi:hypothetical protein